MVLLAPGVRGQDPVRPNILFCLADDQSYPHASAYGELVIRMPVFDRVARDGVLFTQAYCASPSYTPSRSAILTGQDIWRLGEGGQLFGTLPAEQKDANARLFELSFGERPLEERYPKFASWEVVFHL